MGKTGKTAIVVVLAALVAAVIIAKQRGPEATPRGRSAPVQPEGPTPAKGLPTLLDLGSVTCIPCRMMAPMLEELKEEYQGKFRVEFIDVKENPDAATKHNMQIMPTQIFLDASGKELARHEGYWGRDDLLGKWKELGFEFANVQKAEAPKFERMEPAQADERPKSGVCYMCDGDIAPKTLVLVKTDKGEVRLCSPHCYFIMYSCLIEDKEGFERRVSVTDWATGNALPATTAAYLCALEEHTGRPTTMAFADRDAALKERQSSGGSVVSWPVLTERELSTRCGFCDRACYSQDAALVVCGGVHTRGCCSHCALGVTARTGLDIEVHQPDRLTGEMVVVKTLNGSIASIEPDTAVAWFGMKKRPDGSFGSAGCFHQGFFVNADNLKKWVKQNPTATGKLITIRQALANKMKMSPEKIAKACKIGECAPK